MPPRSLMPLIDFEKIPAELKNCHQWVNWCYEYNNDGKRTKVPINPKTGGKAQTNNPETWATFKEAVEYYQVHEGKGLDGIGFVFAPGSRFVGIDLDKCRDAESGIIDPWAQEIINSINSYSEVSPSGTGIKIIAMGSIPPKGRKKGKLGVNGMGKIEMFSRGYFAITGQHLEGTPITINERDNEIKEFYLRFFSDPRWKITRETSPSSTLGVSDYEILEKARKAKNGKKFSKLFDIGDWNEYPSQSEADIALCSMLAFWTGNDPLRIDHLFRQSKLMRQKWDEIHYSDGRTYGEEIIRKVIEQNKKIYSLNSFNYKNKNHNEVIDASQNGVQTHLSDIGNAARFVKQAGMDLKYCKAKGGWLIWDGIRWKVDDSHQVMKFAKKVALSLFDEAKEAKEEERRKAIARHAISSQKRDRLLAMVDLAKCELAVSPDQLDSNKWLLNVLNGTLDLKTGKLLPHRREDLITKLCPVEFKPDATCPLWDSFLWRIMDGNKEMISFLQVIAGICLTGDVQEQVLFIFYGGGSNGKSVFIDTLRGMLGDYASEAAPDLLVMRKNEEHPTEIADLCGKRLVTACEMEENAQLRVQLLKRLTGDQVIKARYMRQDYFEFERTFKIILAVNNKPKVKETTHAVWRRIRLVPFNVTIPEEEQDKKLLEKLKNERPGILRWAVEGCLKWQKEGLKFPEEVKNATQAYQLEEDQITEFVEEKCEFRADAFTPRGKIYNEYVDWAKKSGERSPLSRRTFYERIRQRGIKDVTKKNDGQTIRGFVGIGIKLKDENNS